MSPTLEEMAPTEQYMCVGMWCELGGPEYLVVLVSLDDPFNGHASVMDMHPAKAKVSYTLKHTLTPRFDLPRAWTPSGEPVPGEWEESASTPSIRRWCARWEQKPWEVGRADA